VQTVTEIVQNIIILDAFMFLSHSSQEDWKIFCTFFINNCYFLQEDFITKHLKKILNERASNCGDIFKDLLIMPRKVKSISFNEKNLLVQVSRKMLLIKLS